MRQQVLAGGEFAPEFMQFLPIHFVHIDHVFRGGRIYKLAIGIYDHGGSLSPERVKRR